MSGPRARFPEQSWPSALAAVVGCSHGLGCLFQTLDLEDPARGFRASLAGVEGQPCQLTTVLGFSLWKNSLSFLFVNLVILGSVS